MATNNYYTAQQQMQIQQPGVIGTTLGGIWTGGTAYDYQNIKQYQTNKPYNRIKFFRINEEVEEGSILETLDELRMKVSRWLNKN